jgi:hypothetical protein
MAVERPLVRATTIVPSDATVYSPPLRELFVGGTGNVTVRTSNGDSVLFTAVAANTRLPYAIDKVMATGTTATLMTGWR